VIYATSDEKLCDIFVMCLFVYVIACVIYAVISDFLFIWRRFITL